MSKLPIVSGIARVYAAAPHVKCHQNKTKFVHSLNRSDWRVSFHPANHVFLLSHHSIRPVAFHYISTHPASCQSQYVDNVDPDHGHWHAPQRAQRMCPYSDPNSYGKRKKTTQFRWRETRRHATRTVGQKAEGEL